MSFFRVNEADFKKIAKRLQKAQPTTALSTCQETLAQAFGFKHFHELQETWKGDPTLNQNTPQTQSSASHDGPLSPSHIAGHTLFIHSKLGEHLLHFLTESITSEQPSDFCAIIHPELNSQMHDLIASQSKTQFSILSSFDYDRFNQNNVHHRRISFFATISSREKYVSFAWGLDGAVRGLNMTSDYITHFLKFFDLLFALPPNQNLLVSLKSLLVPESLVRHKQNLLFFLERFKGLFVETTDHSFMTEESGLSLSEAILATPRFFVFIPDEPQHQSQFLALLKAAFISEKHAKRSNKHLLLATSSGHLPRGFCMLPAHLSECAINLVCCLSYADYSFRRPQNTQRDVEELRVLIAHMTSIRFSQHVDPLFENYLYTPTGLSRRLSALPHDGTFLAPLQRHL